MRHYVNDVRKGRQFLRRPMYRLAIPTAPKPHFGAGTQVLGIEYNGLIKVFQRLNILSFDQSIFLSKAKMMNKILNNKAPSYLNEMFLMRDTTLNNTVSNLRSVTSKNVLVPQAKCNLFKGSLSYSGVMVWNSIPVSIKDSYSLPIFIKKCTESIKH